MATTVKRITDANVYLDGVNFLGKAQEITLPDLKFQMAATTPSACSARWSCRRAWRPWKPP